MLLYTDEKLPMDGGCNFSKVQPNEYVVAALNPRYVGAMHAVYSYNEVQLSLELECIFQSRIEEENLSSQISTTNGFEEETSVAVEQENTLLQYWLERALWIN